MARRPQVSQEFVLEARRLRITEAQAELCLEQGYPETTVADISSRAKISRNSFYEIFPSRAESFVALVTRAAAELLDALDHGSPATEERSVDDALRTALQWLADHEALASVLLIDAPTGPLEAQRAQLELFDSLVQRLAQATRGPGAEMTNREVMAIGGVAGVVRGLVLRNELSLAPERAAELGWLLSPEPLRIANASFRLTL